MTKRVVRDLMPAGDTDLSRSTVEQEARKLRLWYHDIELIEGVRTRFPEDYALNPVLERVDVSARWHIQNLENHLGGDLSSASVLDLGCADGLFSIWAARRLARRVVGVERNRRNYERALFAKSVIGLDNLQLRWGSIESHVLDDRHDVVLALGLLYHLVDPLGTINALRQVCTGQLFLTSAIDLDNSVDEPLSRLDRYATGTHGLWAFNAAMIRQLLTTAGFEVSEETILETPGGPHYFGVAAPGDVATHHIFAETIDQEFPINVDRRRSKARALWQELAETTSRPIALFGAGTHTPWLVDQVRDVGAVNIACVLDDRPPAQGTVAGLPCRLPAEADVGEFDAVVLSSWHQTDTLRRRAVGLFGDSVRLLALDG